MQRLRRSLSFDLVDLFDARAGASKAADEASKAAKQATLHMEIKTCESSISTARRLASSRAGPTVVAKPGY